MFGGQCVVGGGHPPPLQHFFPSSSGGTPGVLGGHTEVSGGHETLQHVFPSNSGGTPGVFGGHGAVPGAHPPGPDPSDPPEQHAFGTDQQFVYFTEVRYTRSYADRNRTD